MMYSSEYMNFVSYNVYNNNENVYKNMKRFYLPAMDHMQN